MNAIIYARFSERPEGAEEPQSNDLQREHCEAYCRAHKYHISAFHEDRFLSGAESDNRPGLQAALAQTKKEKGVLVCYALSRLSRDTRDVLRMADELQESGAGLALLDLQMDTTTIAGRMMLGVMALVSEAERKQIGKRTSDALRRKQANGCLVSRYAPYGFVIEGDALKPVRDEQRIVKWILERSKQGDSPKEIVKKLNADGVPFRSGRWHVRRVLSVLRRA